MLLIKYFLIITGEKLQGKIIGYSKGARSTHGIVGYSYTIRVKYHDEFYITRSVQSKQGSTLWRPEVPANRNCTVYFNPKYPKVVSMTGTYGLEVASGCMFLLGILGIIASL